MLGEQRSKKQMVRQLRTERETGGKENENTSKTVKEAMVIALAAMQRQ